MSINFNLGNEYNNFFKNNKKDDYKLETGNDNVAMQQSNNLLITIYISHFEKGAVSVETFLGNIKKCGVATTATKNQAGNDVVCFTFNGKNYAIACNKSEANSNVDSKNLTTYTPTQLTSSYKFSQEQIEKYFKAIEIVDGEVKKYALKEEFGYSSATQLFQENLVINNFLNDMNKQGDTTTKLRKTTDGKSLTTSRIGKYADSIKLASKDEITSIQKEVLQKFVKDFSSGNLAYAQVDTILNAIRVSNLTKQTVNGNYEISFEYDGKKYKVTCNTSAASKGSDKIVDKNGSYSEQIFNDDGTSVINNYDVNGNLKTSKKYDKNGKVLLSPEDRAKVDNYKNNYILANFMNTLGKGEFYGYFGDTPNFDNPEKLAPDMDDETILAKLKSGELKVENNFFDNSKKMQEAIEKFISDLQYDNMASSQIDDVAEALGIKLNYTNNGHSVEFIFDGKKYSINLDLYDDVCFKQDQSGECETISREEYQKLVDSGSPEAYRFRPTVAVDGEYTQFTRIADLMGNEEKLYVENSIDTEISKLVDTYFDALKDINENITKEEISKMAKEIANMKGAQNVDKAEYISARLVDFVSMKKEYPNMTLEEMNKELSINNAISQSFNNANMIYDLLLGTKITDEESYMTLTEASLAYGDDVPLLKNAFIELRTSEYLEKAKNGELTALNYLEGIQDDLKQIWPGLNEDNYSDVFTAINKLVIEDVEEFVERILSGEETSEELTTSLLNRTKNLPYAYGTVMELSVEDIYETRYKTEYNVDNVINNFEEFKELSFKHDLIQDVITTENDEDFEKKLLVSLFMLTDGSDNDDVLTKKLQELTGMNNAKVINTRIVVEQTARAKGVTGSQGSDNIRFHLQNNNIKYTIHGLHFLDGGKGLTDDQRIDKFIGKYVNNTTVDNIRNSIHDALKTDESDSYIKRGLAWIGNFTTDLVADYLHNCSELKQAYDRGDREAFARISSSTNMDESAALGFIGGFAKGGLKVVVAGTEKVASGKTLENLLGLKATSETIPKMTKEYIEELSQKIGKLSEEELKTYSDSLIKKLTTKYFADNTTIMNELKYSTDDYLVKWFENKFERFINGVQNPDLHGISDTLAKYVNNFIGEMQELQNSLTSIDFIDDHAWKFLDMKYVAKEFKTYIQKLQKEGWNLDQTDLTRMVIEFLRRAGHVTSEGFTEEGWKMIEKFSAMGCLSLPLLLSTMGAQNANAANTTTLTNKEIKEQAIRSSIDDYLGAQGIIVQHNPDYIFPDSTSLSDLLVLNGYKTLTDSQYNSLDDSDKKLYNNILNILTDNVIHVLKNDDSSLSYMFGDNKYDSLNDALGEARRFDPYKTVQYVGDINSIQQMCEETGRVMHNDNIYINDDRLVFVGKNGQNLLEDVIVTGDANKFANKYGFNTRGDMDKFLSFNGFTVDAETGLYTNGQEEYSDINDLLQALGKTKIDSSAIQREAYAQSYGFESFEAMRKEFEKSGITWDSENGKFISPNGKTMDLADAYLLNSASNKTSNINVSSTVDPEMANRLATLDKMKNIEKELIDTQLLPAGSDLFRQLYNLVGIREFPIEQIYRAFEAMEQCSRLLKACDDKGNAVGLVTKFIGEIGEKVLTGKWVVTSHTEYGMEMKTPDAIARAENDQAYETQKNTIEALYMAGQITQEQYQQMLNDAYQKHQDIQSMTFNGYNYLQATAILEFQNGDAFNFLNRGTGFTWDS